MNKKDGIVLQIMEGNNMENKKEEKFEDSMDRLEKIATELESGDLDLDASVKKFEEGMELSKKCNEELQNAEKKITMLIEKNGKIEEEEFDTEE